MSDENHKADKKRQTTAPDAEQIEAAIVSQHAREVIEVVGADAVLIVWTRQRRRKTSVVMTSLGNALTVRALMKWIADKVDDGDDEDEDEDDDEDEDEE